MKDRMRLAEVFPGKARALEGHAYSAGQDHPMVGVIR